MPLEIAWYACRWLPTPDIGDKNSVGDIATTQVAVTVGVEKCDGENKIIYELEIIFNLYVKNIMSA